MTATTGRRVHADTRREQFLDAALELFSERGFDATSMKDLAEATGSAPGLAYHYFGSKSELLAAVLAERSFFPKLRAMLTDLPDRPAGLVLSELAERFDAMLSEREPMVRLVAHEAQTDGQIRAELQRRIDDGAGFVARYLESRVALGELRPHDSMTAARAIFFTLVTFHLTGTPAGDAPRSLVKLVLEGIAARADQE